MAKLMLLVVAVLSLAAGSVLASTAEMYFGVIRQAGGFYGEIFGEGITGVSEAWMQRGTEDKINFDILGDEIDVISDEYVTVVDFNNAIAGSYNMEITAAGVVSKYSFTIKEITEGWFPNIPELKSVPETIQQQHDFSWTWDNANGGDIKFIEYGIDSAGFFVDLEYESHIDAFNDKEFSADFENNTGSGKFVVFYGIELEAATFIDGWVRVEGPELFGSNPTFEFAGAEDTAFFNVIPEPGALLVLLTLGCVAFLRRRP